MVNKNFPPVSFGQNRQSKDAAIIKGLRGTGNVASGWMGREFAAPKAAVHTRVYPLDIGQA
jgi:hypothetical protein